MHRRQTVLSLAGFMLLCAMAVGVHNKSVLAQRQQWTEPAVLATEGQAPVIVADSAGDLHLFYVGRTEDDDSEAAGTIYYMSRLGGQWRPPLDILFAPGGGVQILGAAIDEAGNLHVAWSRDDAMFHSRAHASLAGSAGQWQTNVVIPGRQPSGEMVLDESGRLHVVLALGFASVEYLYSDDGGDKWSAPLQVYRELDLEELAIGGAQIAVDREGDLHVTWTKTALEADWQLWSVWYGRSSDEGNSWQVTEMATPLFGGADIAVDADNNIHLVYGRNIRYGDGRWYQWSSDGGETWSNPRRLYPGIAHASGSTGGFDFATDSAGRLHMVNSYGNGRGDASAWHLVWLGTRWSEPEKILDTGFHAHYPRLAIAGGNELDFVAQAPRRTHSLVYRQGRADSPATEVREVPTRVLELETDLVGADTASLVGPTPAVPRTVLSDDALAEPPSGQPFDALLLSVAASAIVILVVVLVMRREARRR